MWKLTIEDDEGKRTPLPLFRDDYTIGRSEENTVRLTERNISRKHARIKKNGNGWALQDLSSYNGSFINGTRVAGEHPLSHGDIIQLGDYRLEFADEAMASQTPDSTATSTVPSPGVSGVKPDRLVVVAGPTPGQEFLIHSASMLIGRATEVDVSLPHVSVSRVHAEIHALGGNRYEIIDKGSANGVRVNGTQLGRALLEAGDFIELGEVKLKFVGAGQVYWPGSEAIRLAPEVAEIQTVRPPPPPHSGPPVGLDEVYPRSGKRALGKNVLMGAAGGAIAIATMLGARHFRSARAPAMASPPPPAAVVAVDPAKTALDEARKLAGDGDLDLAHNRIISGIPSASPLREAPETREIEARWADALLAQAEQESDPATRKLLLNSVAQSTTVDAVRRRVAADRVREMDERGTDVSELPHAAKPTTQPSEATAARPSRPSAALAPEPYTPPPPRPPPSPEPPEAKLAPSELMLQGREGETKARALLEPKVFSGKASSEEIRMLRAICRHQGDRTCSDKAAALLNK
jgi:ABC transport system ATP-binding/permease protein